MPRFPKKEAEIATLTESLSPGLLGNVPIYPNLPVHPMLIRAKSMIYLFYLKTREDFPWKDALQKLNKRTAKDVVIAFLEIFSRKSLLLLAKLQ
jgi:hypothetical protein